MFSALFCFYHFFFFFFFFFQKRLYICSAQSENQYNSGIVLRKVGILTLSGEVGILTLRRAIPELLVRKVGIGTK